MFILDTPELEPYLTGLVLMNTTTRNTFFEHVSKMQHQHQLPDLLPAAAEYHLTPSSETYKAFWNIYKHYCFTAEELTLGEEMMSLLTFNYAPYQYAIEHFYADYQSRWNPTLPTLTLTSENDYICPPDIFTGDKSYQQEYILNKIIPNAGHCPWILYSEDIKKCFKEYIQLMQLNFPK
jgi:pimeloyl-ACP methyl ester carboxylesterase